MTRSEQHCLTIIISDMVRSIAMGLVRENTATVTTVSVSMGMGSRDMEEGGVGEERATEFFVNI